MFSHKNIMDSSKVAPNTSNDDDHNQVESDYQSDGSESASSFKTAYTSVLDINFKSVPLQPNELVSIEKRLQCVVIIRRKDQAYQSALCDIVDQCVISVLLLESSCYGGQNGIALIVIATALNTYIFDIEGLGAICDELKLLLESQYPLKIVHYGERAAEQLLRGKDPIKLNGISDTFVNLCTVLQKSFPCTLPEAISLVLGVPLYELHCNGLGEASKAIRFLDTRPLTNSHVNYLAKMAIFQEKLHDRLLQCCLCKEVQKMSLDFSNTFWRIKKGCSVVLEMSAGSKHGNSCIDIHFKVSELDGNLPPLQEIEAYEQELYKQHT